MLYLPASTPDNMRTVFDDPKFLSCRVPVISTYWYVSHDNHFWTSKYPLSTTMTSYEDLTAVCEERSDNALPGIVWSFTALAVVTVVLRLFARLHLYKGLHWEDYLMVAGLVRLSTFQDDFPPLTQGFTRLQHSQQPVFSVKWCKLASENTYNAWHRTIRST